MGDYRLKDEHVDLFEEAQRIGRCGAFAWDLQTNDIEWSPEFFRILGRGPEDVEHTWDGFLSCVHPDDRARLVAEAEKIMETGEHHDVYYRMVMPDGEVRHWVSKGRIDMDGDTPMRIVGFSQDITEQVRARHQLASQASILRWAQSVGRMGNWQVNLNTGEVEWSDETYRIHGLTPGTEVTIEEGIEFYDRAYRDMVRRSVEAAAESGEPVDFEALIHAADGVDRWIRVIGQESAHERGVMRGIVQDVTDRRELEESRTHRSRMETVGLVAGGVAHDFNNLLSVILGNAELLDYATDSDAGAEYLEEIREAAERGRALTTTLLAFSKKQVVQPRIIDPVEVVQDLRGMLVRLMPEHIRFELSLEGSGTVLMDPVQLEQVVMNLVNNARDAVSGEGKVRLAVATVEDDLYITVSDTGQGIPDDDMDQIFQPFFSTKGDRGTGLGLATVHSIVESVGGTIQVESTPGEGTTFRICVPRVEAAVPEAGQVDLPAEVPHVMFVDDEEGVRLLNAVTLRNRGHRVTELPSGEAALEHIQAHGPPDMIVSDVIMPGISGVALARKVRAEHPSVPFLFISGFLDGEALEILEDEQRPLLPKPFSPKQLRAAMEEVILATRADG